MKILFLVLTLFVLLACEATTAKPPSSELSCEQRFDRALESGVPYTEALGDYTQCLIDRGDTINNNVPGRRSFSGRVAY